jgi:hypothetical protein
MSDYAPIIIFCYRRNIENLISSLLKNQGSINSELFIFSDGYKSQVDKNDVLNLRKSLTKIVSFKSVNIIKSEKNNGLANSIINGVKNVINKFGKAIILEDDLIVSPFFIDYMNDALNFYQYKKNIWSISGYTPPIPYLKDYKNEVYLSLRSSSWGWATWSDRFNKVDWSIKNFLELKKDKSKIKKFELGGNDLFKMLELQHLGKIDSWAIRWCYSQFLDSAYSITPKISMTQNLGFADNLSTHNKSLGSKWKVDLAEAKITDFECIENQQVIDAFKEFHNLSFYTKIGYFLKKWGGYKILKKYFKN